MLRRTIFGKENALVDTNFWNAIYDTRNTETGSTGIYQLFLPRSGGNFDENFNGSIDWGDGNINLFNGFAQWDAISTHTYLVPGIYNVKIYGQFGGFWYNADMAKDKNKLIEIIHSGNKMNFTNSGAYFFRCNKLVSIGYLFIEAGNAGSSLIRECLELKTVDVIELKNCAQMGLFGFQPPKLETFNELKFTGAISPANFNQSFQYWYLAKAFPKITFETQPNSPMQMSNSFYRFGRDTIGFISMPSETKNIFKYVGSSYANILREVKLSTQDYSNILVIMDTYNTNVLSPFYANFCKYNAFGEAARNSLIAKGYTFIDAGLE